ncbi:efflux RND transporter periplasmic adaptor subunit [Alcanivorax sp. 1008]|uniref:efflux RND transporter periplasmic adaptor subunit n=1 Tax=Alcanivorax sp. 1008 TaxID=2816853 RepID=UPI001D91AF42|nr:HlyD family efflux transporter periplasmic adaptor subunit [Alcanivorax sp. 1008]MCC1495851.1 biotin/lipoyl-binding protein [Alcanivorax sp. 1008]
MSDLPARLSALWRELPPVPRLLIGTIVVITLLVLFKPPAPQEPATDSSPRVLIEIARPGLFAPQLSLFGRIESPASATLSSSVTALVQQAVALPGDRVSAGDLILQLDPREAALARAQADAALSQTQAQKASATKRHQSDRKALELEQQLTDLAKQNVGRLERLRETNLASQTQLDEARQALARQQLSLETRQLAVSNYQNDVRRLDSEIERAQAARDQADLDLARSEVRAPFDGRITALHVAEGERVRPGEPLISLYADQGIEIRAQIPLNHLPEVRAGLDAGGLAGELVIENRRLPLRLARLAGEVERGRGGIDGLFILDASDVTPELGRPLPMTLTLPPRDGLVALPAAALHGLDRVYRLDDENRLQTVAVTRIGDWQGADGEQRLLFQGDFQPGDRLVINQLPGAIDGLRVQPAEGGQTPQGLEPEPEPETQTPESDSQ